MRRLYYFSTAVFCLALLGFWLAARVLPSVETGEVAGEERRISAEELSRHMLADDCWMAIDGQVYDLTEYLPDHPSRPSVILAWCGREASEAYRTKGKGKSHSAAADQMLPAYRIGVYAE